MATLLHTGEKQQTALEALEKINIRRRKMQEKAYKIAEKQIALSENIAIAADESFHE
ncbi:hypothetical protein GW750_02095 [bacterium]|nr:hypothetical protein [bacterium]